MMTRTWKRNLESRLEQLEKSLLQPKLPQGPSLHQLALQKLSRKDALIWLRMTNDPDPIWPRTGELRVHDAYQEAFAAAQLDRFRPSGKSAAKSTVK
jgi:hypothetical protein